MNSGRIGAALIAGGLLAMAGCQPSHGARDKPMLHGDFAGSNVILIEVNPLRYDRVGLHGSTRGLTPLLDAFGRRSVRFEQAIAAAPWCFPGKLAMWTGRAPSAHGMHNKYTVSSTGAPVLATLARSIPTYPEALKAAGYAVVGFTGDAGVAGMWGFNRGFDRYIDDREFGGLDYAAPLALEWLRAHQGQRFFLWLNGYDVHWHYVPPKGYQRRFAKEYHGPLTGSVEEEQRVQDLSLERRFAADGSSDDLKFSAADRAFYEALYDEKVQDADARLGQFLRDLEAMGLLKNTMVVVFSGGGEEFFDHGFLGHGPTLYDEIIRVPLLMKFPGRESARVIRGQVRLFDVFPTLMDLLGLPFAHPVEGVSLRPLLNGQPLNLPAVSETRFRLFTHQYALRTADGRYKVIHTKTPVRRLELYDLSEDPREQRNIASQQPRLAYELEQQLFRIVRASEALRPPEVVDLE